jgi:GNAT superfamily N-acetyltransferase
VSRRATESAPPEMATQIRSPGRMWERSKARVAGGIDFNVSCCVSFYTDGMFETRLATVADAELIGQQRRRMFLDSVPVDDAQTEKMIAKFVPWVRAKLGDGSYVGWLASKDGRVVAGAGMWLMEFPPHWMHDEAVRAYLLNFYVDPEFRGHGLAYSLLKTVVGETRRRGIKVVSLHASKFGKPLYERNGFELSNEMILRNDAEG